MQRVAVLSHVTASSVPPHLSNTIERRTAWHGGKISSNKTEALQKFYERKLREGDRLTTQQIEAIQATLGVEINYERGHTKSLKKVVATHRAKVTAAKNHIVLKTGRVLGPKVVLKPKVKKTGRRSNVKRQAAHQSPSIGKLSSKQAKMSSCISLEDKLGLPLHALVTGKAERSKFTKQR